MTSQRGKEREKGNGSQAGVQTQQGVTTKDRIPKERMIPKEKKPKGITEEARHFRKRKKRIAMLHRVDIPRRQREKRTGDQRIEERGTRIIIGGVKVTGNKLADLGG